MGAVCVAVLVSVSVQVQDSAPVPESWAVVCAWLREQADALAADLDRARDTLREAATEHDPALLERLDGPAPSGRPPGYGVLPELVEDPPFSTPTPRERRYSLKPISVNFVTAFRDGRVLAERTAHKGAADLEHAVRDYERLRGDLDNLLDHLAYHEQWQPDASTYAEFFAERNALVADVRAMVALEATPAGNGTVDEQAERQAQRAVLRARVAEGMSTLRPANDLVLVPTSGGGWTLPVTVHTDVTDAAFRAAFVDAVDGAWNASEAARERGFVVSIEFVVHDPDELDSDALPTPGDPLELEDHLARFEDGALVMTTGAASTHAFKGRCLLLGPSPIAPRTLAHEFGHLLGFDDGYLRGFEGDPGGPFGVVFVEWTGLRNDLMGNPRGGRVTPDMIEELISTYGPSKTSSP